jgi:uncharacterized protein (TIGR02246 family)
MDRAIRSDDKDDCLNVIATVQEAWNTAAACWSASALTSVYARDAIFFGGREGHSVGEEQILQYFESYFGVIESASINLVDQRVLRLATDCLLAQGYCDFSFMLAGARRTQSRLRSTLTLVQEKEGWKIRQHHFSTSPTKPPLGEAC